MTTTTAPTAYAPPAARPEASPAPRAEPARQDGIDLLRGLVMVLMLLDHTRDFVHVDAFAYDPTDLSRASPALFLTRWVTHFCAPVFVFLAGTGAYLQRARGTPLPALRRFLVTRGLWLVLLELTLVRFGGFFDADFRFLGLLQVIWVLGVSMIALAALVGLPVRAVAAFGIAMVALHNLADGVRVPEWTGPESPVPSVAAKLWLTLHQGGPFPVAGWPSPVVMVLYPLVPWVGVMAAGYAFGRVYELPPARRVAVIRRLGLALTTLFVALRLTEVYGDPLGWQLHHPRGAVFSALSFLNTQKYPPSLLFLLMTLGPALVLLAAVERRGALAERRATRWVVTFGRVPLFYYLLQWPTAHLAGLLLALAAGRSTSQFFLNPMMLTLAGGPPEDQGWPLWVVYVAWLAGLLLLYPLCRWYAGVKARRRDLAWLRYL
jgi:uncharacterized membrane protein